MLGLKDYNWLWNNLEFLGVCHNGHEACMHFHFLDENVKNACDLPWYFCCPVADFYRVTEEPLRELNDLHPPHTEVMAQLERLFASNNQNDWLAQRVREIGRLHRVLPTVR